MNLLTLLLVGAVAAFAVYLFNRFVPGDATVKRLVTWAAVAIVVIWIFRAMGGCAYLGKVQI